MFVIAGSRGGGGQRSLKFPTRLPVTRLFMTNGQSIPTGSFSNFAAATQVNWDTLVIDEVGACIRGKTNIVTPDSYYNRVRFTGHTSWASNGQAGSVRGYYLVVNGTSLWTEQSHVIASLNEAGMSWETIWWDTAMGDAWSLYVIQNTSGSLTFSPSNNGPGQAWIQAEWGRQTNPNV